MELFLGFFILGFKILDSVYRVTQEHEPVYNVIPIHLCNFAAIAAGLYLICKTRFLFNLAYFFKFWSGICTCFTGSRCLLSFILCVYIYDYACTGICGGFLWIIYLKDKIDLKTIYYPALF